MSELPKTSGGWQQAALTRRRQGSCSRSGGVFLLTGAAAASEESREAAGSHWKPMTKEHPLHGNRLTLRHCRLAQRTGTLMVLHWFSRSLSVRRVSHLISVHVYDSFFPAQILVYAKETASESETIIKYPRSYWITFLWGDELALFQSSVCLSLAFSSNLWVGTIHFQC